MSTDHPSATRTDLTNRQNPKSSILRAEDRARSFDSGSLRSAGLKKKSFTEEGDSLAQKIHKLSG
jgi:hypothetical protein